MTYTTAETSAHDGAPIEGFQFIGTVKQYRYTSAQQERTINGLLYSPLPIARSSIRAGTQDDDALELIISLPFDTELVQHYAFSSSPPNLQLISYRYHEGTNPATDWIINWKGLVAGFSVEDGMAQLRVPSVFENALQGNVPSVFYQGPCNHVLYDTRCKVVKATHTTLSTVTNISADGLAITVANDGVADAALKAGELFLPARGERRLVLANVANVLTVNFPFFDIALGDVAEMYKGCDHLYQGDCKVKFANTVNFGGFPYIPSENPFEGTI